MKIIKFFILFSLFIFFIGCSNKIPVDTVSTNKLDINKNKKSIFIEINNQTQENINLIYDIKKGLKELGYRLSSERFDVDYHLKIEIIYAASIDKKSASKDVLSNVNINVGVGSSSGNFGIYTSIGSTIGHIIGDKMDSTVFQIISDVTIDEYSLNKKIDSYNTEVILTAPFESNDKNRVIYFLEEEIVKTILEIF